ncbi:MAG: DUF4389 domain-containing protein [archaeon]
MGERKEILMRVVVAVVSGVILWAWAYFVAVLCIINWIYTLFAGKRMKELADLSEVWNTQKYIFVRYMVLESNIRPFPFTGLTKSLSKFDNKLKK